MYLDIYSDKLIGEGVVTKEEVDAVIDKYEKICEEAFKKAGEETQVINHTFKDSLYSSSWVMNQDIVGGRLKNEDGYLRCLDQNKI